MPTVKAFIASIAAASVILGAAAARAERIAFDTAARNSNLVQIFAGRTEYTDHIYGELQLPAKGTGPFPAIVIMHSSRGIEPTIWAWAKLFTDMGIAAFVVDTFTPRGLAERSANQLTFPAGTVDALRALEKLQHDKRIDPKNIGVIGFSRGAVAAMNSSFERFRAAILGAESGKFALHIVFYGGCTQYARTTGSPILLLQGTNDDFNNLEVCRKDTEILNQQGSKAELVVYQGALHEFDTGFPFVSMPMIQNYKNCRMLQNLDSFQAMMVDGRTLTPEERDRYSRDCPGPGASRGGDPKFAAASRERVKLFVAEQFKLGR